MLKEKTIERIHNSMNNQLEKNNKIAIPEVLIDIDLLTKENYKKWRKGQVAYLEAVCNTSLPKLNKIINEIYKYAGEQDFKESYTDYRKYGKGNTKLRFSKTGNKLIENKYATVFLEKRKIAIAKKRVNIKKLKEIKVN